MNKFKVGDKVYCPKYGTSILMVTKNKTGYHSDIYPLMVTAGKSRRILTNDGKIRSGDKLPALLHATPENCELLEKLYGVEFEKPPAKPTPKEIIKAMFARGDKYVLCLVADKPRQIAEGNGVRVLVTAVIDDAIFCFRTAYHDWRYAIPIDQQGNEVTELPDETL